MNNKTIIKCPKCGNDMVIGKRKRCGSFKCTCGQSYFISPEVIANPEMLRKQIGAYIEQVDYAVRFGSADSKKTTRKNQRMFDIQ